MIGLIVQLTVVEYFQTCRFLGSMAEPQTFSMDSLVSSKHLRILGREGFW